MKPLKVALSASIVVVLAAVAWALFSGIPLRLMAECLQARIEREAGYRLQIAGSATVSFLPSPTVTIRDITMMSADDADLVRRLTAQSVSFSISLSELLAGRLHIGDVSVSRPVMRVVLRDRPGPSAVASTRSDGAGGSATPAVTIDRVTIEDGAVVLSRVGDRVENVIDRIALAASLDKPQSIDLKAQGRWEDQPLRLQAKVEEVSSPLKGKLALTFEAPGLLKAPLSGSGELSARGATLNIDGLKGTFEQDKFFGWTSLDLAGKPLIKVDLHFQRLGFEATRANRNPGSVGSQAGSQASWDRPWSDQTLDLRGLNVFDADVQVSAGEFSVGTFRSAPISVRAIVADGMLQASFPNIGLYGGQADGLLMMDHFDATPNLAARLNLNGVRAAGLLAEAADFDALDGSMRAAIDIRATGASPQAIMATLSGSADLVIQNGEIRGINVAKMTRALTDTPLTGWSANTAETTELAELGARFTISNGKATTDNLRMMGPAVRVTGAGTADIANKTLRFKIDPKLVMALDGQGAQADPAGLGVPVIIEGTWSEPHIYPDIAGILENPDAAYATLHALGKGLFGNGNNPQGGSGIDNLVQGLGNLLAPPAGNRKGSNPAATPPASNRKDGNNPAAAPKRSDSSGAPSPELDFLRNLLGR